MDRSNITTTLLSILDSKKMSKLDPESFTDNVSVTETYLMYRALYDQFLDVDHTLKILLDRGVNNTFLAPISFCLRMEGNPNAYLQLDSYGQIHIISYVFVKISYEALRDNIIYMLLLAGSNPQLNNYKNSPEDISVSQWIRTYFPESSLDVGTVYSNLQNDNMSSYIRTAAILMNKSDTVKSAQITKEENEIVILARSDKFYKSISNIKNAISFYNARAFAVLVNKISPNYLMSNQLLIRMTNNSDNVYVLQELSVMLALILNRGVYMDLEQYRIVKSLGKNTLQMIDKAYKVPYWRKTCSNVADNNVNKRLKALAISLGVDNDDKSLVCSSIDTIAKSDPQKAMIASLRKQKTIMLGEITNISELIGKPPNMVCRNRSDFDIDPMGYNNLDVTSYRDFTGAIWCFQSDIYADLILTRNNPYTGQKLPDDLLTKITSKLEKLKNLGIYRTMPINEALEELKVPDEFSNDLSEYMLESMYRIMSINGIDTGRIDTLSNDELQNILNNSGITVTLSPFMRKHTMYTLAWIFELSNEDELSDILTQMQVV
mgnify:CR=1 FL=1